MNEQPLAAQPKIERRGGWRRLGVRLAVLAGSLLVTLACLEIGLRLFGIGKPNLIERDPLIGSRFPISFEGDIFIAEIGRNVAIRFNDVGFRGPSRPREKPRGVRRIAVLGDSMVASLAVEESQTMVCQLERLLNESSPETTWEVLNFGVNGSSPGQELVLYRELVARFEPDIVLGTFFVGNDLADNCSRFTSRPPIHFDVDEAGTLQQEPFSTDRAVVSQFLNRHCRLYVWQRTAMRQARKRLFPRTGRLESGEWVFSKQEPPDVAHAWNITARIFEAFQRETAAHGSRFAVVMIPSAAQVYQDEFADVSARAGEFAEAFDPGYPDQRVAEMCRAAGIPFCSLLEDFRQAAPSASAQGPEEWLFCNGRGHFTERGDALAARAVHRFLTAGDPHQVAHRPLLGTLR